MDDLPGATQYVNDALQNADTTALVARFALFHDMQWVLDRITAL